MSKNETIEQRIKHEQRDLKLVTLLALLLATGISYLVYEIKIDLLPESKIDELIAALAPALGIISIDFLLKTVEKTTKTFLALFSLAIVSCGGLTILLTQLENEANALIFKEQLLKLLPPDLVDLIVSFFLNFPALISNFLTSLAK